MSQRSFALDTVHFLNRQTTDSDPFGDRDQVASAQATARRFQQTDMEQQTQERQRQEARQILEPASTVLQQPMSAAATVLTDSQLLANIKRQLLDSNPANLINVLLFWINFQVSRGMPNHNQVVLNVLQDMKNLFVARNAPQPHIVAQLNTVLCTVVQNLNNDDYDSTESIVDFVQIVGVYFMKAYLFERQVVLHDPEAFDLLTTWVYFQYIMKRQMPMDIGASVNANDASRQLLDCMKVFEDRVPLPVL